MNKAGIHEIDVMPFVKLLDSPFDTDRNKALLVLMNAANSTSSQQLISQNGHKNLVALLRLKQPNNHEPTYALLKKVSGKDFGPDNADAWADAAKSISELDNCGRAIDDLLATNPEAVFLDDDNLAGFSGNLLLEKIYSWYVNYPGKRMIYYLQ